MPLLTADELREVGTRTFEAAGVPREPARIVTESLVESNLMGHDSHGVLRIPQYLRMIGGGRIKPDAQPKIVKETASTAIVDGQWGFGQVNARWATELAIKKAKAHSISAVALINNNHVGRLGEYALMAAREGMIGMVLGTGGSNKGQTAPYGGKVRRLSTAPISVAAPAGRFEPFLMDFATSMVAEGKIMVMRDGGKRIPEGWVIDRDGHPTTDPADYFDGGALLPFGGYKGYSLALFVEIMAGILTGMGYGTSGNSREGNSILVIAFDVASFRPLDEFGREMDDFFAHIKSTPPAEGHERVMLPGEPELETKARRLKGGIDVPARTWDRIVQAAEGLGIHLRTSPDK